MPRRALIPLCLALGLAAGGGAVAAGADAPPDADRLERLVRQDCGSCHGITLKGGLGPDIRPGRMARYSPEDLARLILDGIAGTPMPPWSPLLSEAEARWIADYLRTGDRP